MAVSFSTCPRKFMSGASLTAAEPAVNPRSLSRLHALIDRLSSDDLEQVLAKADNVYTSSCYRKALQRRKDMASGDMTQAQADVHIPRTPTLQEFAYPNFGEASIHMKALIQFVTGKAKPERAVVAKDLWVSLGYCMGVVVGEPGAMESVDIKDLIAYVGDVDDKEAVDMLREVSTEQNPGKVCVQLKSMNAANFMMAGFGATAGSRVA